MQTHANPNRHEQTLLKITTKQVDWKSVLQPAITGG
jgi:hypothetical protein